MASNEELRKQLDKAYKAVSNKISRTKRATGAEVGGSEFDPRRNPGTHNRMRSEARMKEYLGELQSFMSRGNQFIAGDNGAPLPRGYFNNVFKKTEAELGRVIDARENSIGSIVGPQGWSMTGKNIAIQKTGNQAGFGPYEKMVRQANEITSFAALKELHAKNLKQLKPDFLQKSLDSDRMKLEKVAKYLGESMTDEMELIRSMDDYEFDLFWNTTTAASGIFLFYAREKEREEGTVKERNQDKVIETKFAEVMPDAKWAMKEGFKKRQEELREEQSEHLKGFKRNTSKWK
jgi:hypothetical protein